jgi:hypothetical protein
MRVGSLLVLCGLLGLASGAVEAKTQEFEAGSWYGAAQFNDGSGAFELCYITGEYESRISVFFQIDYDGVFHIAFEHPDWRLKVGDAYPVVLEVDQALSESYQAVAYAETGVDIGFETAGTLLDTLRYGQRMRVLAQRESFSFLLTGTKAALKKLQDCYDQNGRTVTAANPFGKTSGANPFAAPSAGEAAGVAPTSPDNAAFRHRAAAIFEAALHLPRMSQFKVLHGAAIPEWLHDSDLAWTAGSSYGGLYADLGDVALEEESARITADDSKLCEGDVASAAVNEEIDNGLVVRRLAVSCLDPEDSWYSYYSIYQTSSPDGTWVVRHFADDDRAAAKAADQAIFDMINSATAGRGS